jgi:bacterioferritin-associated ferredoxin
MATEEEILARLRPGCICKGIRLHTIITAINQGAASFQEVAGKTGIGGGSCGSKRCGLKVVELLSQKKSGPAPPPAPATDSPARPSPDGAQTENSARNNE